MALQYDVQIGNGGDTVFPASAEVTWTDLERIHRRNLLPNVLVAVRREITVLGRLLPGGAEDPAAVRAAFGTFMAAHLSTRTIPAFLRIRDTGGVPIPDIGEITSAANEWVDVQLTAFNMITTDPQLKAFAEFTFSFVGTRQFEDGNNFVEFEQELTREGPTNAQVTTTLRSVVTMTPGSDVEAQAALLRLSAPPGTIRLAPSNRVEGISIRFPNWPRTDEAEVVSIVQTLADGVILPTLAGDGSIILTERADPRFGLTRKSLRAEVTGTTDPRGFVEGERPKGSVGVVIHDRARAIASGEFDTREADLVFQLGDEGKTVRIRITWSMVEGGREVDHVAVIGGFRPILRKGPFEPFILTESVEAFALGLTELGQFLMPETLPEPWVFDPKRSTYIPPEIIEYAAISDGETQHLWRMGTSRVYIWDALSDPRGDSTNQLLFVDQFLKVTGNRQLVPPDLLRPVA